MWTFGAAHIVSNLPVIARLVRVMSKDASHGRLAYLKVM
jgi:hypothetical protein